MMFILSNLTKWFGFREGQDPSLRIRREVGNLSYYNRKSPRIPSYDYSNANYYFITICTQNRRCLFGSVDALNFIGKIAREQIERFPTHYDCVKVDHYVVMPNHIHMILVLEKSGTHSAEQIIGQYKAGVSREVRKIYPGINIWQRSFHDHVIRDQAGYENIWLYIEGNPQMLYKDCFYVDPSVLQGNS